METEFLIAILTTIPPTVLLWILFNYCYDDMDSIAKYRRTDYLLLLIPILFPIIASFAMLMHSMFFLFWKSYGSRFMGYKEATRKIEQCSVDLFLVSVLCFFFSLCRLTFLF